MNKSTSFSENDESIEIFKKVKCGKGTNYTSRYCSQIMFNILLCNGDHNIKVDKQSKVVKQIDGTNLNSVKYLPSMMEERKCSKAVCIKGEVYVFGGHTLPLTSVMSVEKYTTGANSWNKVADMYDERLGLCACAFMNKVIIMGGQLDKTPRSSCLEFDAKSYKWKEITSMNRARVHAACAVFDGRIIVSGGSRDGINNRLNTVESLDVLEDTWTLMPNMINSRRGHNLVVVRNRLFVVGRTCEVFDKTCNQFVALESPQIKSNKATSIGNKIIIFQYATSSTVIYDVCEDKWSEELSEDSKRLSQIACVKVPCL